MHGIESNSEAFLEGATTGGEPGDIIVHMHRDGSIERFIISDQDGVKQRTAISKTRLEKLISTGESQNLQRRN
ncbi:hypothetical protein SAMN04487944_11934 [Gracilibacillus ureilyticus]|uniref:Uncharacterized protein n=1 Tax=Gracilibacillus ureilyticus TaxID=531814 RepID=A0A1H9UT73_9BACI|nr:hypothetical protein [Gracilibacillus ureilyticus]SES12539.1 hypothetical protein SAMN04487944_11934 [Gracilibacillus ureilyticus]